MDAEFTRYAEAATPRLLRFAHQLCGDPEQAQELVQAALVKTWLSWRRIRNEDPTSYVRKVIVNTHLSVWRKLRREAPGPVPELAQDADESAGERDRLRRALGALPPRQRAVIVMRWFEGMSEREVAEALGCSVGSVKSQSSRGAMTLRAQLGTRHADQSAATFGMETS
jgi:RNA polymerase sigma-70 factor (sigma-E family)